MKAGLNEFVIFLTNASGAIAPSVTGAWSYSGNVNSTPVVFSSASVTEISGGYYNHQISVPTGQGFIKVSKPGYFAHNTEHISLSNPTSAAHFNVDSTLYNEDDIIGRFVGSSTISSNPFSISSNQGSYTVVAGDDFIENMSIPALAVSSNYGGDGSLTGWTFTVKSVSPLISGGTVSIVSTSQRTILVSIPRASLPNSLVTNGSSTQFYLDIQGVSPTSKYKTVIRFSITLLIDDNY